MRLLLLLWAHLRAWTAGGDGGGGGDAAPMSEQELDALRSAANRPLALPGGATAPALVQSLGKLVAYTPKLLGMADQQMILVHMLCRKISAAL